MAYVAQTISPFAWYFVAIGGFLFSSIIFLLIYWNVKGFRQIFSNRILKSDSVNHLDGPQLISIKTHKQKNSNNHHLEQKLNLHNQSKWPASKKLINKKINTMKFNESICKQSKQRPCCIGLDEGEHIKVIDPLLNKVWSGTISE
ncbi:hypothetical protein Mgra_00007780 [Meloidogyne graminicola]|uniref:Uncharacterized protein n=1 Tax=Meloidogyne graminicola TaxID=189291 RepID=A0A8S9ZHV1_9BILA|nr:hypothetical protein Mgra_00007780 [Meloidogyne graminicola]